MKKVIIALGALIGVLLLAMVLVPIIFKDDIKKAIDDAISENVDAQVYFNTDKFGLTFFSHFPSLTVKMEEFGVANNAPFIGDTLLDVQKFEVAVDVMSVISGDKIKVNGIYLIEPNIFVRILENGKANYDIAKASTTDTAQAEAPTEESSAFSVAIKEWQIQNANLTYIDGPGKMQAKIANLNHSGSGDFTQSVFDLKTVTDIEAIDFDMDGAQYLSNNRFHADLTLNMDMDNSKYTFKENVIALNDFTFGFDGSIILGEDYQEFDLTYGARETSFKSLISLVPALFMKDFEALQTSGSLAFDGFVKGKYQEEQLPDFALNLVVNDGMFQYPDLPAAVKNVTVDMHILKEGASLEALAVDLKTFKMNLGNNPVSIVAKTKGIERVDLEVNAIAKLNLAEVSSFYPIEGLEMKGMFDLSAIVKGVYDENTMPDITANVLLSDAYIKSAEVPVPLEQMSMKASANVSSANMAASSATVEYFKFTMDGQPFESYVSVVNFDDYTYDAGFKGSIDLEKIMKIFPQEGMELKGLITSDITTKGKMSDIEAERYDKLPTSGSVGISQLAFKSEDLPQGMTIAKAGLTFNPKAANLDNYSGTLGKSDIQMTGSLQNYLGYALKDQTIHGDLNFNSAFFDVNEWMTEEEGEAVASEGSTEEEEMTVVPIPRNIDFVLNANMKDIAYDNMNITDLNGKIIIKDGILSLERTAFNTLGGSFVTTGEYNTQDTINPSYAFALNFKNLDIAETYKTMASVQEMAPFAENMTGKVSSDFSIDGKLLSNMMPDMATITGGGLLNVFNSAIRDVKIINKMNSVAKFANLGQQSDNKFNLKDFLVNAEIRDGKVFFEPFDVALGSYNLNIGGNYGLDGALDYSIKTKVSPGALGNAAGSALNQLTGVNMALNQPINLNFGVGGTHSDPQVKLLGAEPAGGKSASPVNVVKETVNNKVNEVKDDAREKAKAQADKILADAQRQADNVKRQGKQAADAIRNQANAQANEVEKKANNPIAKVAAKKAADQIRKEGNDKANRVEQEANTQANNIMNEARNRANQILNTP